jgi:Uma2 family endonuclease
MASVLEQTPKTATGIIPLDNGDVLDQPTFHERYSAMPPGFRAELIGGVVYVPFPATNWHAVYHGDMIGCLFHYRAHTPGVDMLDNGTLILDDDNEPQPDGVLRLDESVGGASHVTEEGYVAGTPELHAEIAFTSASIDLHQKRREYERTGVREYLIVLIQKKAVRAFRLDGARYVNFPPDPDGVWRSQVFPGLWLNFQALLDRDGAALLKTLDAGLATEAHQTFVKQLKSATQHRKA